MVLLIPLMPVDDAQERLTVSEPADVLDPEVCHFVIYAIGKRGDMRRL